jgi:hypothetical protein
MHALNTNVSILNTIISPADVPTNKKTLSIDTPMQLKMRTKPPNGGNEYGEIFKDHCTRMTSY